MGGKMKNQEILEQLKFLNKFMKHTKCHSPRKTKNEKSRNSGATEFSIIFCRPKKAFTFPKILFRKILFHNKTGQMRTRKHKFRKGADEESPLFSVINILNFYFFQNHIWLPSLVVQYLSESPWGKKYDGWEKWFIF